MDDRGVELVSWTLDDGEVLHAEAPDTFRLPARERRENLRQGDIAKLIFRIALRNKQSGSEFVKVERMWVKVTDFDGRTYRGELDNDPYCTSELKGGDPVAFEPRHVIQIYDEARSPGSGPP